LKVQKIQYIEHRLLDWGEWVLRQRDGGAMNSVVSSIYLGRTVVQTSHDARGDAWLAGEQVETDRAVVHLGTIDPVLQGAVFEVYRDGRRYSMAINARRMRITRNCLHERICRAQLFIDHWLRDRMPRREANCATNTARG
jgi:hypothetical protein